MINNLPKTGDYEFNTNAQTIRNLFDKQRGRIARNLQTSDLDKSICIRFATGNQPWSITER